MDFVLRKITRTLRRKSAPVRGFEAASPEILESVDNFTRAVNNEMSAANCDACVQLFLSQFGSLDHNIYSQLDIAEPVTKLMREFITHFSTNLESYQPLDGAFLFLKIGVGDYVSDGLIENEISLLIVQILRSNSVLVLDASQSFVKAAMCAGDSESTVFGPVSVVDMGELLSRTREHVSVVWSTVLGNGALWNICKPQRDRGVFEVR